MRYEIEQLDLTNNNSIWTRTGVILTSKKAVDAALTELSEKEGLCWRVCWHLTTRAKCAYRVYNHDLGYVVAEAGKKAARVVC